MKLLRQFTLRCLLQNKVRTLVTIIGIILSVALFTAVAEGAYSGQQYLIRSAEESVGRYHLQYQNVSEQELQALQADDQLSRVETLSNLGCAMIAPDSNHYPYLFLMSMSENLTDLVAFHMVEGRLPENDRELVIGDNLEASTDVRYEVGQTVTLTVGDRVSDGSLLSPSDPYLKDEEHLENTKEQTYTIVGIVRRNYYIEDFSMPGCAAFTRAGTGSTASVFLMLNNMGKTYDYMSAHQYGRNSMANRDLLMFSGTTANENLMIVLYGLVVVLFVLIMFGSIALIYNSFSISVSERTRQFGLLKSIGATNKQIRWAVLDEAMLLCVIAIPLGLLLGCAGIGLTLYLLRDQFNIITYGGKADASIRLVLNAPALISAAAVGWLTALISAWIPARRAVRITPIEAIRMSKDVSVKKREIQTSPLVEKLFGFPGLLASKNYKRNRKKYRTTVISLFMSIVLFISASCFSDYIRRDIADNLSDYPFDVRLRMNSAEEQPLPDYDEAIRIFGQAESVDQVSGVYELHSMASLPLDRVSPEYPGISQQMRKTARMTEYMSFYFLNEAEYAALCAKSGLDPANQEAMIYDHLKGRQYTEESGLTYLTFNVLKDDIFPTRMELLQPKLMDGYFYCGTDSNEEGDPVCVYAPVIGDDEYDYENEIRVPLSESTESFPITLAARLQELPMCGDPETINIYLPVSVLSQLPAYANTVTELCLYFKTANHAGLKDELEQMVKERLSNPYSVWDTRAGQESTRALLLVIDVFTFGFITLISLIAAANVFNTISTNVSLRRREFATLKSVGMDQRGFGRMMRFECLLYGLKSLLYGLPVSVLMSWLIYKIVATGFGVDFVLPWKSMVISIVGVFLVVFVTMVYAMHKVTQENTIETLRNENI